MPYNNSLLKITNEVTKRLHQMQLQELSYYKTGGSCDLLFEPKSIDDLVAAVKQINREKRSFFLLGAGSNSLVMDDHWSGAVIAFHKMNHINVDDCCVIAEAGVDNSIFAERCYQEGLSGVSWMYYMPGLLGSTVRMNARCYGGEISQIAKSVVAVTKTGELKTYQGTDVFKGYKNTIFMTNYEIVASVQFNLSKGDSDLIKQHMESCKSDRIKKHQFLHPSCGCVFKNNYETGVPSGLLLDRAEVRQFNTERVEISPFHANFVFNKGATAAQILEVTLNMREAVFQQFGVWLEYEMEILGHAPDHLLKRYLEKREQQIIVSKLAPLKDEFQNR